MGDVIAAPGALVEDILASITAQSTTKRHPDERDVINARLIARHLWAKGWRRKDRDE